MLNMTSSISVTVKSIIYKVNAELHELVRNYKNKIGLDVVKWQNQQFLC